MGDSSAGGGSGTTTRPPTLLALWEAGPKAKLLYTSKIFGGPASKSITIYKLYYELADPGD